MKWNINGVPVVVVVVVPYLYDHANFNIQQAFNENKPEAFLQTLKMSHKIKW